MTTLIYTAADLQNMSLDLAGDYELANAIDASATSTWNAGAGFVPVGNGANKFTGTFNGAGYTITGLTINRPASDYQALFGYIDGGDVSNVSVGGTVSGKSYVGGLAGRHHTGSTISNCISSIAVTNATSAFYVGGIAGKTDASTIENSYSTGAITVNGSFGGGIAGQNSNNSTVIDCYSTSDVTAVGNTNGGVVGSNFTGGYASACFASGLVTAANTGYLSQFVGNDSGSPSGGSDIGHISAAQMLDHRWFKVAGWDYATIWDQQVALPDITGMTLGEAGAALALIGMTIGTVTEEGSETVPDGHIISQATAAGGTASMPLLKVFGLAVSPKVGDTVDVVVSLGADVGIEIPNVLSLSLAAATTSLEGDGFTVASDTDYSSDFAADLIMAQLPAAGTSAAYGSEVTVTVSLGVEQVTVPDVVGETTAAATAAIEAVGLTATPTTAYSTSVAIGKVISQSPAAASTVDAGSIVAIVSSLGALVPDVVGEYYLAAQALIEAQSLVYASIMDYSSTVASGYIISQSPAAGAAVAPGSTVTATISRGAESGPFTLNTIKTVLSRSSAFRTWVGAATPAAAAAYVFPLTADRELKDKADGYNCAVISHGTGFAISRATLGSEFQTLPEYEVEFVSVIDVNDEDSVVFNALLSSIAGILADLLAQSTLLINDVYFATDKTPQRAAYGSRPDWVSVTLILKCDDWQD